jgi:histidinol-phosphate/aromatic aminotransferase/cobyric acid decarboxylase-like protein
MTSPCFHGGAFWKALDPRFEHLSRRDEIIAADVLDAWFPPSPAVLEALQGDAGWIARTSPPTQGEGLIEAISEGYSLPASSIVVGGGSSSLIYLALGQWLNAESRVLLIEPSYGEYGHVCRNVVGCQVATLQLSCRSDFRLNVDEWLSRLHERHYDLAVLVNPNNPTGAGLESKHLSSILAAVPKHTRVLVDEAYIDYTALGSIQSLAARSEHVFVVKSLSKCFALSGLRVAYLCGNEAEVAKLRRWSPPWAVSLPAQVAAIRALGSRPYYEARYRETDRLRESMKEGVHALGLPCVGAANWLMIQTGRADDVVSSAADAGIFLRHAGRSAPSLGNDWIRTAVGEAPANAAILARLEQAKALN